MSTKARIAQKILLTLLLVGSAIVSWQFTPPEPLAKWVGGNTLLVRAVLSVGVYFLSICVLVPFGVFKGLEIGLPFGLSVKSTSKEATEADDKTLTALSELRTVIERSYARQDELYDYVEDLAGQVEEAVEKIGELERRTQSVEAQVSAAVTSVHHAAGNLGDEPAR
jgi:hypothetical protein